MAAEEADQPFEYCDIVSTTTHKSLRGPRAGMIFFRRVGLGRQYIWLRWFLALVCIALASWLDMCRH